MTYIPIGDGAFCLVNGAFATVNLALTTANLKLTNLNVSFIEQQKDVKKAFYTEGSPFLLYNGMLFR
jgi:hypothetical protein